jgi:hypothetical protein
VKTQKSEIISFDDLIQALEPVELDQIQSDIPANERAELIRIKRNLSAILSFLGNHVFSDAPLEPSLAQAISVTRQECMTLHMAVSKALLYRFFRLDWMGDARRSTLVEDRYEQICRAVFRLCQLNAPQLAPQLSTVL